MHFVRKIICICKTDKLFCAVHIRITNRTWRDLEVGIAYIIICFLGLVIIRLFPQVLSLIPPCMFRLWSGIPCPSCGGTHCAVQLAHFHFLPAFLSNPFIFVMLLLLTFWGMNTIVGLVTKKNVKFILSTKEKRILKWSIILTVPINWIYLITKTIIQH